MLTIRISTVMASITNRHRRPFLLNPDGATISAFIVACAGLLLLTAPVTVQAQGGLLSVALTPTPTLLNVGNTQTWEVDMTNTSAAALFVNGLSDGVDSPLVLDDSRFQNHILSGLSVGAQQTVKDTFTITAPRGASGLPGPGQQSAFQGYLTLTGGSSEFATDVLASTVFQINVAGVPEMSTLLCMAAMMIPVTLLRGRQCRTQG